MIQQHPELIMQAAPAAVPRGTNLRSPSKDRSTRAVLPVHGILIALRRYNVSLELLRTEDLSESLVLCAPHFVGREVGCKDAFGFAGTLRAATCAAGLFVGICWLAQTCCLVLLHACLWLLLPHACARPDKDPQNSGGAQRSPGARRRSTGQLGEGAPKAAILAAEPASCRRNKKRATTSGPYTSFILQQEGK